MSLRALLLSSLLLSLAFSSTACLKKEKKKRPPPPLAGGKPGQSKIPPFNPNDLAYNRGNALFLAQVCEWSYMEAKESRKLATEYGLQLRFQENKELDAEAIFVGNKDFVILAFRGTEATSMSDIMTDLRGFELTDDGGGGGHTGFKRIVAKLERYQFFKKFFDFRKSLTANGKAPPIFITGHSLGAALATLAAEKIGQNAEWTGLYTYAQPITFNKQSAAAFDNKYKVKTFRFVNYKDGVTRVGVEDNLIHIGRCFQFDEKGTLRELGQQMDKGYSFGETVGIQIGEDHSLASYIENLTKPQNEASAVKQRG